MMCKTRGLQRTHFWVERIARKDKFSDRTHRCVPSHSVARSPGKAGFQESLCPVLEGQDSRKEHIPRKTAYWNCLLSGNASSLEIPPSAGAIQYNFGSGTTLDYIPIAEAAAFNAWFDPPAEAYRRVPFHAHLKAWV